MSNKHDSPIKNLHTETSTAVPGVKSKLSALESALQTFSFVDFIITSDLTALETHFPTTGTFPELPARFGSALHLAALFSTLQVFHYLTSKCDINYVHTETGNTVMHMACMAGRKDIIDFLMKHEQFNWECQEKNFEGKLSEQVVDSSETAAFLSGLQKKKQNSIYSRLFELAITKPFQESNQKFISLLQNHPSLDLSYQDEVQRNNNTLGHVAAGAGNYELCLFIGTHGGNLQTFNTDGVTVSSMIPDEWQVKIKEVNASNAAAPDVKVKYPTLEGYLDKWGNYAFGYRKRWFVLENGILSYFKSRSNRKHANAVCRGYINLRFAQIRRIDDKSSTLADNTDGGKSGRFMVSGKDRGSYHLKAENLALLEEWISKLQESVILKNKEPYGAEYKLPVSEDDQSEPEEEIASAPSSYSNGPNLQDAFPDNVSESSQIQIAGSKPPPDLPTVRDGVNGLLSSSFVYVSAQKDILNALCNILIEDPRFTASTLKIPNSDVLSSHPLLSQLMRTGVAIQDRLLLCSDEIERKVGLVEDSKAHSPSRVKRGLSITGILRYGSKKSKSNPVSVSDDKSPKSSSQKRQRKKSVSGTTPPVVKQESLSRPISRQGSVAVTLEVNAKPSLTDSKPLELDEDVFYDAAEIQQQTLKSVEKPPESSAKKLLIEDSLTGYPSSVVKYKPRLSLPLETMEKRPDVSVMSIIKESIGKDLTRLSVPVYYNEPISMLQRLCEEVEYSEILDIANAIGGNLPVSIPPGSCITADEEYSAIGIGSGQTGDPRGGSLERLCFVAAFAISNYSNTDNRMGKPFNPLLGETFEWVRADKGFRYIAEQVSHHPPVSACNCESDNYVFYADANIKIKFSPPQTLETGPQGIVHLRLKKPQEHYSWRKVTTYLCSLIFGKMYIDNGGVMTITNHDANGEQAVLNFKLKNRSGSTNYRVEGEVLDKLGNAKWQIEGYWNKEVIAHPVYPSSFSGFKDMRPLLLWRAVPRPANSSTNFNFTYFAIQMNELYPELLKYLPPTDCRLRPDQRAMERGDFKLASEEKNKLEIMQRGRERQMAAAALQKKQGITASNVKDANVPSSPPDSPKGEASSGSVTVKEQDWWSPRWFYKGKDAATGEDVWLMKEGPEGYWETRKTGSWNITPIFE